MKTEKKKYNPKKVNIIDLNPSYRAAYEINNMGWVLQKKNEEDSWEDLCYPHSLAGCIKKMVELDYSLNAKNLEEVVSTINSFQNTVDELLKTSVSAR